MKGFRFKILPSSGTRRLRRCRLCSRWNKFSLLQKYCQKCSRRMQASDLFPYSVYGKSALEIKEKSFFFVHGAHKPPFRSSIHGQHKIRKYFKSNPSPSRGLREHVEIKLELKASFIWAEHHILQCWFQHLNDITVPLYCSTSAPTWVSSVRWGQRGTRGARRRSGATGRDGVPPPPCRRPGPVTQEHTHAAFSTLLFPSSLKFQPALAFFFLSVIFVKYVLNLIFMTRYLIFRPHNVNNMSLFCSFIESSSLICRTFSPVPAPVSSAPALGQHSRSIDLPDTRPCPAVPRGGLHCPAFMSPDLEALRSLLVISAPAPLVRRPGFFHASRREPHQSEGQWGAAPNPCRQANLKVERLKAAPKAEMCLFIAVVSVAARALTYKNLTCGAKLRSQIWYQCYSNEESLMIWV